MATRLPFLLVAAIVRKPKKRVEVVPGPSFHSRVFVQHLNFQIQKAEIFRSSWLNSFHTNASGAKNGKQL